MSESKVAPLVTAVLAGGMILASCVSSNRPAVAYDETAGPAVRLTRDIQPILDAHCVQCHFRESPQAGLNLEAGDAYGAMVNVPSTQSPLPGVRPGKPDESYLIHKLRGTHLSVGGVGAQMPYGAEQSAGLAVADLEKISRWVAAGAPDN